MITNETVYRETYDEMSERGNYLAREAKRSFLAGNTELAKKYRECELLVIKNIKHIKRGL